MKGNGCMFMSQMPMAQQDVMASAHVVVVVDGAQVASAAHKCHIPYKYNTV
jgi:hypothetical protein